jgi:hypothetical protein
MAFGIHRNGRFEEEVVKRFFKQSQISSFRRQLNLYGFTRISNGRDAGAYYNEYFLRGKPLLTLKMVRTRIKGTRIRASSSPDNEPHFYSMSFMGPSIRPEYVARAALEKNMMTASINPIMLADASQNNNHSMVGSLQPFMNTKYGAMSANGVDSRFPLIHEATSSAAMRNENQLISFQQNPFLHAFAKPGVGAESRQQLYLERGRLQQQQERMMGLLSANGNTMNNNHNSNIRRIASSMNPPVNMQQSMRDMVNMSMNMDGVARYPASHAMQEMRSSESLSMLEQKMMQQQNLAQMNMMRPTLFDQNMNNGLLPPSFSMQGTPLDDRNYQGSSTQNRITNQSPGQNSNMKMPGNFLSPLHNDLTVKLEEQSRLASSNFLDRSHLDDDSAKFGQSLHSLNGKLNQQFAGNNFHQMKARAQQNGLSDNISSTSHSRLGTSSDKSSGEKSSMSSSQSSVSKSSSGRDDNDPKPLTPV